MFSIKLEVSADIHRGTENTVSTIAQVKAQTSTVRHTYTTGYTTVECKKHFPQIVLLQLLLSSIHSAHFYRS